MPTYHPVPTRLFCLHFAGGNRYSLRALEAHLPPHIRFVGLETPGRGSRLAEPQLADLPAMARDLYQQIQGFTGTPYLIYGHSMGGMLGFLLLRELQRNGHPMPIHFFVSGCMAPQYNVARTIRHTLSDAAFVEELVRLGGMPAELLSHRELLQLFLPIIRADFQAVETYQYTSAPMHSVPITALKGSEESISEEQLLGWQAETNSPLKTYTLAGNHFFILNHLQQLAGLIQDALPAAPLTSP